MGTYCYTLSATKHRKIDDGGVSKDIHLVSYSHKLGTWRHNDPAWLRAKLVRLDNCWAARKLPELVAIGDEFKDGVHVYTGWKEKFGGSLTDDRFCELDFVGVLRMVGKRLVLDRWHVIKTRAVNPAAVFETLRGLVHQDVRVEYVDKSKLWNSSSSLNGTEEHDLRVVIKEDNDFIFAKLALCG